MYDTIDTVPTISVDPFLVLSDEDWRDIVAPEMRQQMLRNRVIIYAEDQDHVATWTLNRAMILRWLSENITGFAYIGACEFQGHTILFELAADAALLKRTFHDKEALLLMVDGAH